MLQEMHNLTSQLFFLGFFVEIAKFYNFELLVVSQRELSSQIRYFI